MKLQLERDKVKKGRLTTQLEIAEKKIPRTHRRERGHDPRGEGFLRLGPRLRKQGKTAHLPRYLRKQKKGWCRLTGKKIGKGGKSVPLVQAKPPWPPKRIWGREVENMSRYWPAQPGIVRKKSQGGRGNETTRVSGEAVPWMLRTRLGTRASPR